MFGGDHADGIAAADLFVVPTIDFKLLCCLVILDSRPARSSLCRRHGRQPVSPLRSNLVFGRHNGSCPHLYAGLVNKTPAAIFFEPNYPPVTRPVYWRNISDRAQELGRLPRAVEVRAKAGNPDFL